MGFVEPRLMLMLMLLRHCTCTCEKGKLFHDSCQSRRVPADFESVKTLLMLDVRCHYLQFGVAMELAVPQKFWGSL